MNNYCLMAGQMMSLVTHNANRCVSFMKIVGFVWNCMTEWFFGPSSELAAMTAHLPGCRCKMSQHKLDELSHHGMKPGTGLNLAWCTELHYARQGLMFAWDASTKIPHSTIPSKMWFTELYIFGWKSSLSKRLSSIRRQWESGATVSSSGHEKVKRGLDKCALCSLGQGSERFTVVSAAGMSTQ